jgi:hypothetical protein
LSFFSDLFEGHFDKLGTDLTHAPSSFINHPAEIAETGAAILTAVTLGAAAPEAFGALGAFGGAEALGGLGAAEGLTAATDVFGAFSPEAFAAESAGLGLGAEAVGGLGADALAFLPGGADALALGSDVLPEAAQLATGSLDLGGAAGDALAPSSYSWTAADITGSGIGSDVTMNPAVAAYENPDFMAPSLTKTLGDTLNSPWTKLATGLAPLGLALGMGGPKLPAGLGTAEANATALARGGSNLNPSQQASLTQMRQNAVNAARQAMFNQGVKNPEADTRWSQMVANIDSQVTAAAQTMIQQNIQNSLAGDRELIAIAQLQMQSDAQFANMLMQATKAFGTTLGFGGGGTFKLTPA